MIVQAAHNLLEKLCTRRRSCVQAPYRKKTRKYTLFLSSSHDGDCYEHMRKVYTTNMLTDKFLRTVVVGYDPTVILLLYFEP